VLRGELTVRIASPAKRSRTRAATATATAPAAAPATAPAGSSALFEHLRALRKRLADEHGLPPYVVFHDATLREMAERRPRNLSQFADLPGVGEAKLARYGERFIAAIVEHAQSAAL
jgi:ATP-dependent DNA helicase RecQ